MKNGHSEDEKMTHVTLLLKLKILNLREWFFYESAILQLIEVKKKVSAKRVLWLFFTSFRYLWSRSWTNLLYQQGLMLKLEQKIATSLFVIIKKKRIGSYLLLAWLQMQCSRASFCIFLWSNYMNCYPNFMTCFYFPLALVT